jgi:hypothetical protein
VASMNVTLGVPRIKEIINGAKNISTPIMKVPTPLSTHPPWQPTLLHGNLQHLVHHRQDMSCVVCSLTRPRLLSH